MQDGGGLCGIGAVKTGGIGMAELKPCPFCGRQPKLGAPNMHRKTHVLCRCGISGPYEDLDTVVSQWNTRATEPEVMTLAVDTRTQSLLLIDNERNRQDAKWGEQNYPPQLWTGILMEEVGEYAEAVNETVFDNGKGHIKGGYENMMTELTHVAAVAVGAIECLIRNKTSYDCQPKWE